MSVYGTLCYLGAFLLVVFLSATMMYFAGKLYGLGFRKALEEKINKKRSRKDG